MGGDLYQVVRGNRVEVIEGSLDIRASKDINVNTESNHTLTSSGAIDIFSNTNTHIQSKEQLSISANNTEQLFESDYNINAGNQITHQVGDTSITTKGDSVIIKAGGVEVVIDSNGLVVKGGEIKAE